MRDIDSDTVVSYDLPALADRLRSILGDESVRLDEPMSEHTTFKIDGPAQIFATPQTADTLKVAVETCRAFGAPFFILGCGSDLLVSDDGYEGVIICLADGLADIEVEGTRMTCQAGVTLADAAEAACALSLTGLEFACGIPGSIGGAVFMNAGAYDGQMADIVERVDVIAADGTLLSIPGDEMEFGYRMSRVRKEGLVVVSATLRLEEGDEAQIRAHMDDLTERRESKQPLDMPSAGSTFKRPEGYFAGKLITDAGMQGQSVGGAQVSLKHAGFVVNTGDATAADVRALIARVQEEVKRQFGVDLEPEVRFLGKSQS